MVSIDGRVDLSQYNLSTPQKDALKKATSAEQVTQVIAADGLINAEEEKLLAEITQEMMESSDGTLKFKDGDFEAKNNINFKQSSNYGDTVVAKVESVNRLKMTQSTYQRDKIMDQVSTVGDAKRVLKSDLAQANGTFKTDRFTAGKILLQDSTMLTRMGLVKPDDQAFLNQLLAKTSNQRLNVLTPADLTHLKEIVDGAMKTLDGLPEASQAPAKYLLDESALHEKNNYVGLNNNFDALISSSEAAINDANLAVGESGLNKDQIKAQGAKQIQAGASFSRINNTVRELDRQADNLAKSQTILEQQIPEIGAEIEQRTAELISKGEDPTQDPILTGLKSSLQTNVSRLQEINQKRGQINQTKIHTLTKAKEFGVIVKEFDKRMLAVQSAQGQLAKGCQTLERLNKWADQTAQKADASTLGASPLPGLTAAKTELGQALEMAKQTTDDMSGALNNLLTVYKGSPTANKTAISLLSKEIETLKTVKASLTGDNVKDKLKELTAVRTRIINAMKPMVADGTIDPRELKALTVLDENVDEFTGKASTLGSNIKGYAGDIDSMIKEAKLEKTPLEKQSNKAFELIKKFSQGDFLAYGTHMGANLNVTVGAGNQYVGIGAGITAGFKVEKTLAGDPNRELQMSVNIGVMVEAHAGFDEFFSLDAEFKASLQAGLAFSTAEDAQKFMQTLADGVKGITDGGSEGEAKAKAAIQEMKAIIAGKSFAGTITSGKVELTAGDKDHPPFGQLTGKKETSTKNYGDGAKGVEKTLTLGGKFEAAHGKGVGIKYSERATAFTDKNGHNHAERTQTISVAIPVEMISGILEKMKLGKISHFTEGLDAGTKEALVAGLKEFGFDTTLFNHMHHGLANDKLEEVLRVAKLKGESEVMIGFERHFHGDGPDAEAHDYVEFGLEGAYSAEVTATSGSAYAKVKGEASYELAVKVPIPHMPVPFNGGFMAMPATNETTTTTGEHH